jgi:glycosyltransferase involved in cell wall biosynthesis
MAQKAAGTQGPTFCIVDPTLKNLVGHHFAYDAAVAHAASQSGYVPLILAHRAAEREIAENAGVEAVFAEDMWGARRPATWLGRALAKIPANFLFLFTLAARVRRLPPRSIVFVHSFIDRQILGLALLPLLLSRKRSLIYVYLLRYQPDFYRSAVAACSFFLLERIAERCGVRLATDSERLRDLLEECTTLPIEVLPIPHVPPEACDGAAQPSDRARRCRLVSLGSARDEKGIYEILDAIRILHRDGFGEGYHFVLQCNDPTPEVADAIAAFQAERLPNCELLVETLSPEAYYRQLHQADVVLLPYWRSIYTARTSGVFMEALAAGKPVIATRDSWMSDQLATHGAGMLCDDRNPAVLARAIRQAAADLVPLSARARVSREQWLAQHNPRALVQAIASPESLRVGATPRRIALLYPWEDFVEKQGGASRRCNLLVDFLAPKGASIRVLQSGRRPPLALPGCHVSALGRVPPSAVLARVLLRLAVLAAAFGKGTRHDWIIWQFVRLSFIGHFRRRIRRLVRWADVVLLEYPFWMSVVGPIARQDGKRVVLTVHDIMATQMSDAPALRNLAWRFERRALGMADRLVAVSSSDQATLRDAGLQAELAPNPADSRLFDLDRLSEPRRVVAERFGLRLPGRHICLFVGSLHEPNVIAAARIRELARRMRGSAEAADIGLVVAGGCAPADRDGRFVALGRVEDALLMALYALADLVLIPLPYGTGTSLKTIEAMAGGKVVLGTAAAFRGLEVTSGIEAVVEDDLDRYPERMVELLGDDDGRAWIGASARRFAARYDCRSAYQPYLDMLGLHNGGPDEGVRPDNRQVNEQDAVRGNDSPDASPDGVDFSTVAQAR